MSPGLGTILRLVGPLIQVASFGALFLLRGRDVRILGQPAAAFAFGGIALGFACVVVGLALSRRTPRPKGRWDLPREAPGESPPP